MANPKFNIPFVKLFPMTALMSVILVFGSLILFFSKGLNYGVDFRGGAELQIKFEKNVSLEDVRKSLDSSGFTNSQVQSIGEETDYEYLVKVASNEDLNIVTEKISTMFRETFKESGLDIRKTDIVGPKAGEQLRNSAFQALIWSFLLIMVYIGLRFDFEFAPGAVVALIHDVIIVVGIFSLTGKEFSLQIVGALLAIVGYSVNDTVVVYDRVRENIEKKGSAKLAEIIDLSINETLTRTILTSLTTLFVAIVMYALGGGVIHDFFFAMSLGIIIGTYSSIFIATPMILLLEKFKKSPKAQAA